MSTRNGDKLSIEGVISVGKKTCPDCGSELREGPHGGMNVNWLCVSPSCGSKFNHMGPFGVERISDKSPLRKAKR